jgi:16S rRNA (cytosine1402-N4)-methyltransferase
VQKVLASGKTPAGMHLPIMVDESSAACGLALGGGCRLHARRRWPRARDPGTLQPGGRLIGLDVDPLELPRTEAHLRAAGFGADAFVARQANFAGLAKALAAEGLEHADVILADLGVSSMQFDNPDRGFSYKGVGPLDMRMNPRRGEPASQLIARVSERRSARLLADNADEPHSHVIARLLKAQPLETTHAAERLLRAGPHVRPSRRGEDGREDVHPPHVPGAAHRGQRRVLGARCAPAVAAPVPRAGRPRCGADVSFRRRPAGEEGVPGGRRAGVYSMRRPR